MYFLDQLYLDGLICYVIGIKLNEPGKCNFWNFSQWIYLLEISGPNQNEDDKESLYQFVIN